MGDNTQMPEEPINSSELSQESRSETVVNPTIEGVVVIDENSIIQTFNPAAETLFGYQAHEVIGKNVTLLMPESDRSPHNNSIKRYLQTGKSDLIGVLRELNALRKDGSLIPIEISANPINLGEQRFFVGTMRDLSEKKDAEARKSLLHNITQIFSTSEDPANVCPKVLKEICEFMGWEITFCWKVDRENQVLQCYQSWHSPENKENFQEFVERSYEINFKKGKGLPGRIWKKEKPQWIQTIVNDDNFPRSPFALRADLNSGFGFPIFDSNDVIGIIEVFSNKTIQPNEETSQLLSSLGNQIGQFFERNDLKQRLLKDQQNFFNMLENLPVCFHLQASDYSVPFANKMFRERFGSPTSGKKCYQLMHKRAEPCEVCTPFEIFETNETMDSIWTSPDGKTYLTVVTPFEDIDGSKLVMEMAVDITKEKKAEKENELFHERLHKMVEGCATAYNDESFFQLLVKNLASALQVRCAFIGGCLGDHSVQTHAIWFENDFIDNANYALRNTPCEHVIDKGVFYCSQNLRTKFPKDPMLVDLNVDSYMGVAFFDVMGKRLGLLSVMDSKPIEDPEMAQMILEIFAKYAGSALERKKIYDKLQGSNKNLEATNEELRDFIHIASHDLKEPLRKIISFGDLIKLNIKAIDEKDNYYLQRMESSSLRLQNLIDDLVNFSTMDSLKVRQMKTLDLNDIVQQVFEDLEVLIEQTDAEINVQNLPTIEGNSFQMFHLFQNLIGNALKYKSREGKPLIIIKANSIDIKDDFCKIYIIDNGIGFDEKFLDRMFKPFQRLHRSDEFEGTGMGLAICKKIVNQHKGTITAEGKLQKGATFIIQLPLKQGKVDG